MKSDRSQSSALRAACVLAAVLLLGCDQGRPALYPVSGVVTFRSGDPVRHATIEFVPEKPGPSPRGRVDATGRFVLGTYAGGDGAPAGDYLVVVAQPLPPAAERAVRKLGAEHEGHQGVPLVALKHGDPLTTGVTGRVEAVEQNELTIVVDAH